MCGDPLQLIGQNSALGDAEAVDTFKNQMATKDATEDDNEGEQEEKYVDSVEVSGSHSSQVTVPTSNHEASLLPPRDQNKDTGARKKVQIIFPPAHARNPITEEETTTASTLNAEIQRPPFWKTSVSDIVSRKRCFVTWDDKSNDSRSIQFSKITTNPGEADLPPKQIFLDGAKDSDETSTIGSVFGRSEVNGCVYDGMCNILSTIPEMGEVVDTSAPEIYGNLLDHEDQEDETMEGGEYTSLTMGSCFNKNPVVESSGRNKKSNRVRSDITVIPNPFDVYWKEVYYNCGVKGAISFTDKIVSCPDRLLKVWSGGLGSEESTENVPDADALSDGSIGANSLETV